MQKENGDTRIPANQRRDQISGYDPNITQIIRSMEVDPYLYTLIDRGFIMEERRKRLKVSSNIIQRSAHSMANFSQTETDTFSIAGKIVHSGISQKTKNYYFSDTHYKKIWMLDNITIS